MIVYVNGQDLIWNIETTATTAASVLMPLFWLAGLAIFAFTCFSCHFFRSYTSPLLKRHRTWSFFMHSSHDFLSQLFFLFPVFSTSITSRIWELISPHMTWPYHHNSFELSCPWSSQQHPPYQEEYQLTSYQPVSPHTSSWSYNAPPHATSPHPLQ